jgi:hypothetical protein
MERYTHEIAVRKVEAVIKKASNGSVTVETENLATLLKAYKNLVTRVQRLEDQLLETGLGLDRR